MGRSASAAWAESHGATWRCNWSRTGDSSRERPHSVPPPERWRWDTRREGAFVELIIRAGAWLAWVRRKLVFLFIRSYGGIPLLGRNCVFQYRIDWSIDKPGFELERRWTTRSLWGLDKSDNYWSYLNFIPNQNFVCCAWIFIEWISHWMD